MKSRSISLLNHREIHDFNTNTKKIFNLLSISGKYQIIGSSGYNAILYNSDYDLQEYDIVPDKIYNIFKNKFIIAKNNPTIFITDFKCGEDDSGETIRWSYADMMLGYIIKNNYKITFNDALEMKKTVKLDMICLISGRFLEFSENYYLKLDGVKLYKSITPKETLKKLNESALDELKDGNYYKYLKRRLSIAIIKDQSNIIKNLTDYFNSIDGFLYKQYSDLKILTKVLDCKFHNVKLNDVRDNLQVIKQNLSSYPDLNLSERIDKICLITNRKSIIKHLEKIIDFLGSIINNKAKEIKI